MGKPDYDTSIARMAGNIAAGLVLVGRDDLNYDHVRRAVASHAVEIARLIVEEIRSTEQS